MKKIISALLSAVLLCLTMVSCGKGRKEPVTQPPDGPYFMLEKLPDIEPYASNEVRNYFFGTGAAREFETGKSYGELVPYYSSRTDYAYDYGDTSKVILLGLATADGRIVTDGIYVSVERLESSSSDTLLLCEKLSTDKDTVRFDIINEDGSLLIESEAGVGSENAVRQFKGMPCECVLIPTKEGMELYSYKGEYLTNLTKAFGADCFFNVYYCDGERIIFSAVTDMYSENAQVSDYFCINKEGDLIYTLNFDDYYPLGFENGYFILSNNEKMKLSDVLGNIVETENEYNNIIYDRLNKAFWGKNADKGLIEKISLNGEAVISKSVGKIDQPQTEFLSSSLVSSILVRSIGSSNSFKWFTVEGEDIEIDKEGLSGIGIVSDDKYDYVAAYYRDYVDFYDASGTYITTIKDMEEYYSAYSGKLLYRDTENRLCIKGLKGKGDFKIKLTDEQAQRMYVDEFNGETVAFSRFDGEKVLTTAYSIENQQPFIENAEEYLPYETNIGTYYRYIADDCFVLMNPAGEKIISIRDKSLV